VARQIVLRQLTMGPRTRAQLEEALARRKVPEDAAKSVLDRFSEVGLVDDGAYAEAFLRSAQSNGTLSRRGIAERLRGRGVGREIIAEAVARIDPDEESEAALDLARRRAPRLAGLDAAAQQRRLAGLLTRRGFPPDVVRRVVGQVLGESADA
jgi:regulatory protein